MTVHEAIRFWGLKIHKRLLLSLDSCQQLIHLLFVWAPQLEGQFSMAHQSPNRKYLEPCKLLNLADPRPRLIARFLENHLSKNCILVSLIFIDFARKKFSRIKIHRVLLSLFWSAKYAQLQIFTMLLQWNQTCPKKLLVEPTYNIPIFQNKCPKSHDTNELN